MKFKAQKTLTRLWVFFLLIVALFLFLITFANYSPENSTIVRNSAFIWSWFTKSTLPYISLILTSMFALNHNESKYNYKIDRFYFQLAMGISIVYFAIILFFIGATQSHSSVIIIEIIKGENDYIMTFFQVFVTAILGYFFTSGGLEEKNTGN